MTIEDRLRRAIEERTSSVDLDGQAGLERITDRLLAQGDDRDQKAPRPRWMLPVAAVALAVVATAGVLLVSRMDPGADVDLANRPSPFESAPSTATPGTSEPSATTEPSGRDRSETTESPDTTASPGATAGTEPGETVDPTVRGAIWPRPSSDVRFEEPEAAARSFALYYARFDDPLIGVFQAADPHSGEVPVRPYADGPLTVVRLSVSQRGQWFVTGSWNEDILVERPQTASTLNCPMATSGTALAFEGTVQVRIDAYQPDGDRVELGRGLVTGSGAPPPGPFSEEIACTTASGVEDFGIATFWTEDASGQRDGPLQVVAIPVRLP